MGGSQRVYLVVAAMIRRNSDVLLVQQHEAYDPAPTWVLPGGKVEPHELLHDALAREVREETGLVIHHPGRLIYVGQVDNLVEDHQLISYTFEIYDWSGTIACSDPDCSIIQADFFPIDEAIRKLENDHFRPRCEAALAYLRGKQTAGSIWLSRRSVDKPYECVWPVRSSM